VRALEHKIECLKREMDLQATEHASNLRQSEATIEQLGSKLRVREDINRDEVAIIEAKCKQVLKLTTQTE